MKIGIIRKILLKVVLFSTARLDSKIILNSKLEANIIVLLLICL